MIIQFLSFTIKNRFIDKLKSYIQQNDIQFLK